MAGRTYRSGTLDGDDVAVPDQEPFRVVSFLPAQRMEAVRGAPRSTARGDALQARKMSKDTSLRPAGLGKRLTKYPCLPCSPPREASMIDIAEISKNLQRRLAPGPNICEEEQRVSNRNEEVWRG